MATLRGGTKRHTPKGEGQGKTTSDWLAISLHMRVRRSHRLRICCSDSERHDDDDGVVFGQRGTAVG
ncbi:MAG: hypothetical protein BYD32DRAFT_416141 [Podila humilis]|nr:MAG: hypothetical protein BYD32DRAFT_416141 [Podila humilis]